MMIRRSTWAAALCYSLAWLMGTASSAAEVDVAELTATIRDVGPNGAGNQAASAAWQQLAQADAAELPEILRGFSGAGPLAVNWLRPAVDAIAERELAAGGELPVEGLLEVVGDRSLHPLARQVAYEWVIAVEPSREETLLAQMLDDPSAELRRAAVAATLEQAVAEKAEENTEQAVDLYQRALDAAHDVDQIESAVAALNELGESRDLAPALGFIQEWQLVGPFEAAEAESLSRPYAPEEIEGIDLSQEYEGKEGSVAWQSHSTVDDHGTVDLNEALGKHIEAVAYAFALFASDEAREVELRLGSQNGTRVWLNGELISDNPVYHTGANIDQYVGRGELRPGVNTILVKIRQDDPGQAPWAGSWGFQLRVCDESGAPLQGALDPAESDL